MPLLTWDPKTFPNATPCDYAPVVRDATGSLVRYAVDFVNTEAGVCVCKDSNGEKFVLVLPAPLTVTPVQ